ncbi:MAG: hypothetical protein M3509_02990 [Chloroflexota bacterium]|nr:hypothetical protein [Chloroflexota bacterium]
MASVQPTGPNLDLELLSPTVRAILHHLCSGPVEGRSYGLVVEWCETRGDCTYGVLCPDTGRQFVVDDSELTELRQWTDAAGNALVCGVRWE